jgi:hypothetical protein
MADMSKKIKIKVVDLLSHSSSHLAVNCFWMETILERYAAELYAESEHYKSLESMLEKSILGRKFCRGRLWKLKREMIFFQLVLRSGDAPLMVMGATGMQLLTLSILEKFFPSRAQRWLVVLHSEVEGVEKPIGVMKYLASLAIKHFGFATNCKAVVLGSHIYNNLKELGLVSNRNYSFIEHPLPNRTIDEFKNIVQPAKLAIIGLLRADTKNLSMSESIASDERVKVYMIGRRGPGYFCPKGVEEYVVENHYTNSWMKQKLEEMDCLLLCPLPSNYRFTALGTVTDALTYSKPMAWVKHDALAVYESSPLSISADNIDDLIEKMLEWSPPDLASIDEWRKQWNYSAKLKLHTLIETLPR